MATDKHNTKKPTEETKKTPVADTIDRDKSFSEREHGRTHDSPKTKVNPKTS
jgi:hypothetical protein